MLSSKICWDETDNEWKKELIFIVKNLNTTFGYSDYVFLKLNLRYFGFELKLSVKPLNFCYIYRKERVLRSRKIRKSLI